MLYGTLEIMLFIDILKSKFEWSLITTICKLFELLIKVIIIKIYVIKLLDNIEIKLCFIVPFNIYFDCHCLPLENINLRGHECWQLCTGIAANIRAL